MPVDVQLRGGDGAGAAVLLPFPKGHRTGMMAFVYGYVYRQGVCRKLLISGGSQPTPPVPPKTMTTTKNDQVAKLLELPGKTAVSVNVLFV